MNTPTLERPTAPPAYADRAIVNSLTASHEPEMFLIITLHGARTALAWTAGGEALGNKIDTEAAAAGLDMPDWVAITERHCQIHHRGRHTVHAHPLRPIQADVRARHGDVDGRVRTAKLPALAQLPALFGCRRPHPVPGWCGVGPTAVHTWQIQNQGTR
jgi:hypothetical protein